MGFFSSAFFWGGLVILIGLSIILHSMGIKFPLFRFAIGIFFVWLGLSIIFGAFRRTGGKDQTVAFESTSVEGRKGASEFNAIFGSVEFDLTGLRPGDRDEKVEVNAVFGEAKVIVDMNTPLRIEASAAFGQAKVPDGSSVAFGDTRYESPSYRQGEPALVVKVSAVFGSAAVSGVHSAPAPDTVPASQ